MSKSLTGLTNPPLVSRRAVLLGMLAVPVALSTGALGQQLNQRQIRRLRRRRRKGRRKERRQLQRAIRRGEAKPLFELMQKFVRRVGGEVLDVRYLERGPYRFYVFIVLSPDGRIERYVMDAMSERIFTPDEARRHYGGVGD